MDEYRQAEAFIFDCDGTLLDTLDAWDAAEAELFAEAGELSPAQQDEVHAAPIAEAARILHERYGVKESTQAVLEHLDSYLLPFYGRESQALPGAVQLVQALHEKGIPLAVLSSSPQRYLRAGLQRAGILDCFAHIISTEDADISKQDPAIFTHAMSLLGSAPHSTWGVDDAPYALKVMRAAGMRTIAVGNGCAPDRESLLRQVADVYAPTLRDVSL